MHYITSAFYIVASKCRLFLAFLVKTKLGFGNPGKTISKIINEGNFDLLIMGTHGHTGFKDLLFGTTVDNVRHKIKIPLFLVKN